MASIPGSRFDITGASGSQGLLSPKSSWRCYVFPRGGYASQASTGTTITFDAVAVASRFAANDWVQVGLLTANIRQVGTVGGNSLTVNTAVTVAENDRVFLIGSTQPTTTGGSATYLVPRTVIRERDDDGSDRITNSMVTSNADGLIQFFAEATLYDCLIQDGNQANQGSIIDVPVGIAEGVSTSLASVFGATVTINATLGVTGTVTGGTFTVNQALGVTGWATFGSTVTMNASAGVTGTFAIGATLTVTGRGNFGNSVSIDGALGVTGAATLMSGLTVSTGILGVSEQPRFVLSMNVNQGLASGTGSDIEWQTEHTDVGGFFASGNSTYVTIPAGLGGTYLFEASVQFLGHSSAQLAALIRRGGITALPNASFSRILGFSAATGPSVSTTYLSPVVAGETVSVLAIQTSGDSVSIDIARFGGVKLF